MSKTSIFNSPEGELILKLKFSYHLGLIVLFFILVSWISSSNNKVTEGLQSLIKFSLDKSLASITVTYNFDLFVNPSFNSDSSIFLSKSLFLEISAVNSSKAFSYLIWFILTFSSSIIYFWMNSSTVNSSFGFLFNNCNILKTSFWEISFSVGYMLIYNYKL